MSIGERIKRFRKQKGLTQTKLAENAGISRSYLADMEANRYNPSLKTLIEVAKALGIAVTCLLEVTIPETSSNAVEPIKPSHVPTTIAAHFENREFTEKETEEINDFISFLTSKNKK